jgi:hypothetical protein
LPGDHVRLTLLCIVSDHCTTLVAEFVNEFCRTTETLRSDTDLFEHLRISGDDVSEFMERFAARFEVDLSSYLWYFHHDEEFSLNFGALIFKRPNERVERIPITPAVLSEAIKTKSWPINYPDHRLPEVRWDIVLNLPIMLVVILCVGLIVSALFDIVERAVS